MSDIRAYRLPSDVIAELSSAQHPENATFNPGGELVFVPAQGAETFEALLKERGLPVVPVAVTEHTLRIEQMDCSVEEHDIREALAARGISGVTLNVLTRSARFLGDATLEALIIETIATAGYTAKAEALQASTRHTIAIPEMDCPVEEQDIARELQKRGISGVQLNVMSRTAHFEGDAARRDAVIEAIKAAGYSARVLTRRTNAIERVKVPYWRFGAAFIFAALSEVLELVHLAGLSPFGIAHALIDWLSLLFAVIAILTAGLTTLKAGLAALKRFEFNMTTLMAVAVIGAVLIGAWPEAAMVMVLFEISETIEDLCMTKARRSIRELMAATPAHVALVTRTGTERVPVAEVAPGAVIRVAPGERFPLDGRVLVGSTSVDQSNVTGESLPVDRTVGDAVWGGTVNLTSTVDVRVTAAEADSLTARIIDAVENAQAAKSPVQRFVDRFAAIYTPLVFIIALGVAIIPPLYWGSPMSWLYKALCLLVIACPCALVISTPVTIVSALGTATRCGLLIKGGLYLEQARHLKCVALDKTGTLTRGEPRLEHAEALENADVDRALAMAASLAAMNKHPLSEAIVRHANARGITRSAVSNFTALPGRGVRGVIRAATYSLLKPEATGDESVIAAAKRFSSQGMSSVVLTDIFGAQLIMAFADAMKAGVAEHIRQLKSVGIRPVLLTGDNREAAERLAAQAGISDVRANLLPEDKLKAIEALETEGVTAMVGDGINDAPALARADIGIAMGIRGTDSAIEAAHVAVMDDNIGSIATLVRLSELAHKVLLQNIVFAISIKLIFMLLTFAGLATMWMAVFADTGTCLIVVANGMRLLRAKPQLDAMAAEASKLAASEPEAPLNATPVALRAEH